MELLAAGKKERKEKGGVGGGNPSLVQNVKSTCSFWGSFPFTPDFLF